MLVIGLTLGIGNAQAQPAKMPRVAFLYQTAGACKPDGRYNAFEQGLRDLGYVPGRARSLARFPLSAARAATRSRTAWWRTSRGPAAT
jgi:hypothetical protein